jgi:uncharacterized protein (TIGR00730 family)
MYIGLFCSSNDLQEAHTGPALALAQLLAENTYNLVYGGSNSGLMGVMANTMQQHGAKVTGVTIPIYSKYARKNNDEMIVAKSLGERKAIILERADAIVTLAGGLGTLDELTEVLELKRENLHDKPLLVLNTDGFYDGLQHQLERIANEKLFKTGENDHIPLKSITQFIEFFTEPAALVKTLNRLLAPIELPLQK